MSILVVGDPHFHEGNIIETDILSNQVPQLALQHKVVATIFLGDFVDKFHLINMKTLRRCIDLIKETSKICTTIVLIGNHDRVNNKDYLSDLHPFMSVNEIGNAGNIHIIHFPKQITLSDYKILLIPYVPNGMFEKAIQGISPDSQLDDILKDIHLIFAHQEFYNCKFRQSSDGSGSDVTSTSGDKWPLDYPMVISGHIHEAHSPQPNIIYPGTPFQQNFGESEDKGVYLLQLDNLSMSKIYLPIPPRVKLQLTYQELYNSYQQVISQSSQSKILLVVRGKYHEINLMNTSGMMKSLTKSGVKVKTFIDKDSTAHLKDLIPTTQNYLSVLKSRVRDDEELMDLYSEIFTC